MHKLYDITFYELEIACCAQTKLDKSPEAKTKSQKCQLEFLTWQSTIVALPIKLSIYSEYIVSRNFPGINFFMYSTKYIF